MKKKVIAILLSLCMAVSGSSVVFAADDDGIELGEVTLPTTDGNVNDSDESEVFQNYTVVGTLDSSDDITYIVPDEWSEDDDSDDDLKTYIHNNNDTNMLLISKGIDCSGRTITESFIESSITTIMNTIIKSILNDESFDFLYKLNYTFDGKPAVMATYNVSSVFVFMVAGMVTNDSKFVTMMMTIPTYDVDKSNMVNDFIGVVSSVHDKYDGEISVIGDEKPDGTYVVGTDIENGYYSVVGNDADASYEISGKNDKFIVNNDIDKDTSVDIQLNDNQTIVLKNCSIFRKGNENASAVEQVPTEYKNALEKAKGYSDMNMSKSGIYDQLTSEYGEQFPADAAKWAVDNLDADYNKNALEKAKSYQTNMHMSKAEIYDQLTSEYGEQFTADEAQYAVDNLD